ncbi:hypothetical protein [Maribacter luteus]|uniref:Uncharacterized protein n=1 Tax=Maribacter luteus TaxID=2594478 RepID=A0A6I2MQB9_9FLAO|nr:hypothetical protein [Maribacter luteus]MRX64725.1 hypothetical protein [Maribacter luteus]
MNQSLNNFEFEFIKESWSHTLFKKRIGKLGDIGYSVFNHIYETNVKSAILNANLNLINKVKHSGATLKHIKTAIIDNYAEVTYLLIEDGFYYFTKYRIDFHNDTPYLSDIYSIKEDRWFSDSMREMVLLNIEHNAFSANRHSANRAFEAYQFAMNNGDYYSALYALEQIPESHQIFNDFKIAKINLAAQLGDSIMIKTIRDETIKEKRNIYIDYLMAFYSRDSIYKEDVNRRIREEIGISKHLLDSLNTKSLIWE